MKFIKFIPYIIIIIAIIVAGFFYQKYQNMLIESRINHQNELASKDSIILDYDAKQKTLEASTSAYIASEKELKNINLDLADEVKRQKGKVIFLGKTVAILKQDTITLRQFIREYKQQEVTYINDSTVSIPWDLTYKYDSVNSDYFSGATSIEIGVGSKKRYNVINLNTELLFRESHINLTFGQKIEDDKLRIFIKSNYPGFTTQSLSGVLIDPNSNPYLKKLIKKKHWFTGFGVGPNITLGYDFIGAKPSVILGIGIQYNIYQW